MIAEMVRGFAEVLMSAEADLVRDSVCGEVSPEQESSAVTC